MTYTINTNKIDLINSYHKKYYASPNTPAKCKEWILADMMERYKKNKKSLSEPDIQGQQIKHMIWNMKLRANILDLRLES
jgi:Asp-tRNA(Asn)/Glu-tRNA(Gln) amidotransferase B subunit